MAARHLSGLNAAELNRNNVAIKKSDDPAYGAHEALWLIGAPIHVLGPVDGVDLFGQKFNEDFLRRASFIKDRGGKVFAFGSDDFFQLVYIDAGFFGEGVCGRRRLSIFIGDFGGRAGELLLRVWLRGRNSGHEYREPSWRFRTRDFARGFKAIIFQQLMHALLQFLVRLLDHARGNFFTTNFKEKVRHQAAPPFCVCALDLSTAAFCWARYALARPTASCRMRAMTPTRSVTEMAPRASRILKRCEHFRQSSYAASRGKRSISAAVVFLSPSKAWKRWM